MTPPEPSGARVRRLWAPRRTAAAITALLLLAAAGTALYETVAERSGHAPARWRTALVDGLPTHRLDSPWAMAAGAAAVALGLWLLVLAATPGRRSVLLQQPPNPVLRPGLDRAAAAALLHDTANRVSGVGSVAVRVRPRRVRVSARVGFRETEEVRAELHARLAERLDGLALARRPRLRVHAERERSRL